MIKLTSWQKVLIGLVLGILAGSVFGQSILIVKPIGALFIRAIHMIIVPVVFLAIVNAISSIEDLKTMRRVAIRAFILYAFYMILAASIGLLISFIMHPGLGIVFHGFGKEGLHAVVSPTASYSIVDVLPDNIVSSFASGNILQILIFAIVFGLAMNMSKEHSQPVIDVVHAAFQIIIKVAQLIMWFAPFGVFALIACVTGEYGLSALIPLLTLVVSVYVGCALLWVCYALGILILMRISPVPFFKAIIHPVLIAFTTSSSAATLPVTLATAEKELNIQKGLAHFLLPLGTSLNLNGLSVYLSVATMFAANVYGIHLTLEQYAMIPFFILFTAVGAAAVPGSALIVMGAIQTAVGIPLGAIPLIAAVDRLNDMAQTCSNVAGDLFATYVVNYFEKK